LAHQPNDRIGFECLHHEQARVDLVGRDQHCDAIGIHDVPAQLHEQGHMGVEITFGHRCDEGAPFTRLKGR
jgi:hypothetical protein